MLTELIISSDNKAYTQHCLFSTINKDNQKYKYLLCLIGHKQLCFVFHW
jgi:hypothetical protein